MSYEKFYNMVGFNSEGLSEPRPKLKLKDRPFSGVRDCLFNVFVATHNTKGRSSIRNMRARHGVVTGTDWSRTNNVNVYKMLI